VVKYRPQRIAIPADRRHEFFAATTAGVASFAVFGVFNSVVPSFLAGTMHDSSHAAAGAVAFAAFAAGAIAQISQVRVDNRRLLRRSVPTIVLGLVLLTVGMWEVSLPIFVIGGIVSGAGGGMVFKGALVVAASTAPPGSRAEVLSGFFLGSYVGLSVPVVGLGIASEHFSAQSSLLVFAILAVVATVASVRALTPT
jgi:hypothetical protein